MGTETLNMQSVHIKDEDKQENWQNMSSNFDLPP